MLSMKSKKSANTSKSTDLNEIRIVVADRHPVIRNGICYEASKQAHWQVVGTADNGPEVIALVETTQPTVLIVDVNLHDMNGLQLVQQLYEQGKVGQTRILVFSEQRDKHHIWGMLSAGAHGYLLKNEPIGVLMDGIAAIARGEVVLSQSVQATLLSVIPSINLSLSEREKDILFLLGRGLSNVEISRQLQISESTVNHHISKTYHKLPTVRSRAEAVAWVNINRPK